MTKLKELERRLREEPDNLGLRVVVAGALHDAGRRDDAVELYRSVALAYRAQGRPQQAITVCRNILELAPGDVLCQELLAALLAAHEGRDPQAPQAPSLRPSPSPTPGRSPSPTLRPSPSPTPSAAVQRPTPLPILSRPSPPRLPRPPSPELLAAESPEPSGADAEPQRRSSGDVTPLPTPLPYHVAEPTMASTPRLTAADLPPSLREELAGYPEIAGIASAARQISAELIAASAQGEAEEVDDVAGELDTGRFPRDPPLDQLLRDLADGDGEGDGDDDPTLPPRLDAPPRRRTLDDEQTEPRDRPRRLRPPSIAPATVATGPLASSFFAPLPPHNRSAVLQRFRRRMAAGGMIVIRRGETGHGLILVLRGQLERKAERADGSSVVLGAIAPGEYVGEDSLLARAPATADVVAAVESELLVLAADDFYDVTGAFPALWAELKAVADGRAVV
jgi:Cyclic nucleotide-binding domain